MALGRINVVKVSSRFQFCIAKFTSQSASQLFQKQPVVSSFQKQPVVSSFRPDHSLEKLAKIEHAKRVHRRMKNPLILKDPHLFKRLESSFNLCKSEASLEGWNSMIELCYKFRKFDKAEHYFVEMQKFQKKPDVETYNLLLSTYRDTGNIEKLDKMRIQMKRNLIRPNIQTYATLIKSYSDTGKKLEEIFELVNEMKLRKIPISENIYNRTLLAAEKTGKDQIFWDLFKNMQIDFISPNVLVFDSITKLLPESVEAKSNLKSVLENKGIVFNPSLFYRTLKDDEKSWQFIKEYADGHCYALIMENLQQKGKFKDILSLYKDFQEKKAEILQKKNTTDLNRIEACVLQSLAELEPKQFLLQVEEILARDTVPSSVIVHAMLEGISKLPDSRKLSKTLHLRLLKKKVRFSLINYNTILHVFARDGDYNSVISFMKRMRLSHIPPNTQSYNALIDAFHNGGRYDACLPMIQIIQRAGFQPNIQTFESLMTAASANNDLTLAESLWLQVCRKHRPTPSLCNTYLRLLCRAQETSKGIQLMKWMTDRNMLPAPDASASFFSLFEYPVYMVDLGKALQSEISAIQVSASSTSLSSHHKLFQGLRGFLDYAKSTVGMNNVKLSKPDVPRLVMSDQKPQKTALESHS